MANKATSSSRENLKQGRTPKEKKAAKQAKTEAQTAARKAWEK